MRRIMHVISTPQGIGGAERVLIALLEAGEKRGWDQLVLNPFSLEGERSELAEVVGVPFRHRSARRLTDVPMVQRWLHGHVRSYEPGILHAHLFHALVAVGSLRRPPGTVAVLNHQHGDRKRSEGKRLQAHLDRRYGKKFDHVVACSNAVSRFLLADCGYEPLRVTTIRNGWAGSPRPRVTSSPFTVVCVANMRPAKGHDVLLEAFALFHTDVPNARLLLVGDGPLRPQLTQQVASLGLGHAVEFVGAVGDIWPFLARAHVAALPSNNETFGIAALEAMAAGLPVVGTHVGGIPELVKHGVTGRLIPPGNPIALSDALHFLYRNPLEAERMGQLGAQSASEMTMERMADRYFSLYERLIGGHG